MNAANQRQLTPLLVIIVVLLGAALLLLLGGVGRGAKWDPPRAPAPLPPPGSTANLPQPKPLQQFALVWQKPLFSPDRKPIARAVDGGSSLGDLELTGIILTRSLHMALLHDKNGDKQVRLKEGSALPDGSITLVEVRARSAVFDAPSGRTELKLAAGAPIDAPKNSDTARDAMQHPDTANDSGMTRVQPSGAADNRGDRSGSGRAMLLPHAQPPPQNTLPSGQPQPSAADRLRENIQKRRAARAAAANAGVR
jgi:general secretion pathway protein N